MVLERLPDRQKSKSGSKRKNKKNLEFFVAFFSFCSIAIETNIILAKNSTKNKKKRIFNQKGARRSTRSKETNE